MKYLTWKHVAFVMAFAFAGAAYAASIPSPRVEITRPVGEESWVVGSTETITWFGIELDGPFMVEVQRDGGKWQTISKSLQSHTYDWKITGPTAKQAQIRITDVDTPGDPGFSGIFSIVNKGATAR